MDVETETHLEPPFERCPAPNSNPKRLHDTGDGIITLQSEMGLLDDLDTFRETLALIRTVWREHSIDAQVPYKQQHPEIMQAIKQDVVERLPFLSDQYEDAWPITFYLKTALKRHGSKLRRNHDDAPYRYRGKLPQDWGERRLPMRPAHQNTYHQYYHEVSSPIPTESAEDESSSDPRRDIETCSTSSSSHSILPLAASPPPVTPSFAAAGCDMPLRYASDLTTSTTTMVTATSQSILDLLIMAFNIPCADAQHLVELLESIGITELRYLRVLAHMHSRHAWLQEVRENGRANGFQVLVLQEVFERIVKE